MIHNLKNELEGMEDNQQCWTHAFDVVLNYCIDTKRYDASKRVDRESTKKKAYSANKGNKKKKDLSKVRCYNCNEFGHYKRDCPKQSGDKKTAQTGQKKEPEKKESKNKYVAWMCRRKEVIKSMFSRKEQSEYVEKMFMLDSGSTDHVCGDL